jgi:D-alanyl-lipoteichoic acid acyltransferase DltB (MBOAT superfamily)
MLFQSREFVLYFLPVALIVYFLICRLRSQYALIWLVIISVTFYAIGEITYSFLFVGSVVLNYTFARYILNEQTLRRRRLATAVGIVLNLTVLGYFKYRIFLGTSFGLVDASGFSKYALPLGLSFYTFQKVAFLVDCYTRQVTSVTLERYAVFVTFFPQLIAGPIVHHKELIPQFSDVRRRRFDGTDFATGVAIFLLGMFKKIALADNLARYANPLFDGTDAGGQIMLIEAWAACFAFTLQIYFDFSGYSDMAIGLARMLRIELPINFDSPYKATSITEFWRRWHMTLSRFLRDYLYIPLGGNRFGTARRYFNLFVTMLLGGLWHGANWTFVVWGGLHGLYLTINHMAKIHRDGAMTDRPAWRRVGGTAFGWVVTFLAVMAAWVVFRANSFSGALDLYKGMAGLNGIYLMPQIARLVPALQHWLVTERPLLVIGDGTATDFVGAVGLIAVGFMVALLGRNTMNMSQRGRLLVVCLTFGFCLQHLMADGPADSFIYFRF